MVISKAFCGSHIDKCPVLNISVKLIKYKTTETPKFDNMTNFNFYILKLKVDDLFVTQPKKDYRIDSLVHDHELARSRQKTEPNKENNNKL